MVAAAASAAAEAAPAKPFPFVPASESRFASDVDFTFPMVSYLVPPGTPLENVLKSTYWGNLRKLRGGVRIWCHWEDDSMVAELLVRKVGQGYANVTLLRQVTLSAASTEVPGSDFRIEWISSVTKHRVVRVRDNFVLKDKLETAEDAQAWLTQHRRVVGAS